MSRIKAEDGTELSADPAGPLAAQVFKTTADQFVGKLTYLRVVSGTLKADSHVWNANRHADERIGQLFVVRGKNQDAVHQLVAGDIGAVAEAGRDRNRRHPHDQGPPAQAAADRVPEPGLHGRRLPAGRRQTPRR